MPFFVIGSYGVSGAQSPAVLLDVLAKAWSERGDGAELPEGAACGPDGC